MNVLTRNFAAALAALLLAAPAAADRDAIAAAKQALQSGVNAGNAAAVLEARARFAALAAAEPGAALPHYWFAVATWRAVPLVGRTDRKQAVALGEEGLRHCDAALAADPKFAEALAVRGGLLGMLIGYGGGSAMSLGPEADASLARAGGMQPDNPRILLLDGVGTLNRPKLFGGGAKKALALFEKSRAAFEAERATDAAAPDWGREDAWLWSGRAHDDLGEWGEAVAAYRKALEVNPEAGWVRNVLLPAAEKKLAGGKKS